jgi:hypothetical protein
MRADAVAAGALGRVETGIRRTTSAAVSPLRYSAPPIDSVIWPSVSSVDLTTI